MRIHLVLDLRGQRAREVLFEREGVRGYFAQSRTPWQSTAAYPQGSAGADDRKGIINLNKDDIQSKAVLHPDGIAPALYAGECRYGGGECYVLDKAAEAVGINGDVAGTLDASYYKGCGQRQGVEREIIAVPYTLKIRSGCEGGGKGALVQTDKSATLATNNDQYLFQPVSCYPEIAHTLTARHDGSPQPEKGTGANITAYAMQAFGVYKECGVASGLKARDYKDATDLVCGIDCRNLVENTELYPTLQAKPNGGQSLNFSHAVRVGYIVRRLTPTECARLQGFADRWGDIDIFPDWTDEDYRFWLNVRNTHAAINGKQVKEYTEAQMLTWYHKLQTDSAEYKMWGNGIALPPALYCMQGMAEALQKRG